VGTIIQGERPVTSIVSHNPDCASGSGNSLHFHDGIEGILEMFKEAMAIDLVKSVILKRKASFQVALDHIFPAGIHIYKVGAIGIRPAAHIKYSLHSIN
jgi:hypothetical protein